MTQFQSFFISATGDASQCDELNAFLKSHVVVRTVENFISTSSCCGIQMLVEFRPEGMPSKTSRRVDWRAQLKSDGERVLFDRLKEFRASLAKEKKLAGAYMVCKDEHLAAIVQNPAITADEIKALPHAGGIMLSDFADMLLAELHKIQSGNEAESVPF